MSKVSRAEHAGRRLGESINEMVHLMYQNNTAKNFWKGLYTALRTDSICLRCFKKYHCKRYCRTVVECSEYGDEKRVI